MTERPSPFIAQSRIRNREGRGHGQDLPQATLVDRCQDHSSDSWIDRKGREVSSHAGESPVSTHRAQFVEGFETVANEFRGREFDEREGFGLAQAQIGHPKNHAREVGAQDLRGGELRSLLEGFLVKPEPLIKHQIMF